MLSAEMQYEPNVRFTSFDAEQKTPDKRLQANP